MAHSRYQECTKSELDLFAAPHLQTSIEKAQWVEYFPISNITESGPVEFNISGSGEEYTDLRQAWLYVKVKVTKDDGGNLVDGTDKVGPSNLFLQTLFSQVDVSLNDKMITESTNTNPYKALISTLLTYGSDAKRSQLTAEMFYKDTAGKMDVVDPSATSPNQGLKTRYSFIKESATVELIGPLHVDLFYQDRLLLNGVSIRVRLKGYLDENCETLEKTWKSNRPIHMGLIIMKQQISRRY